MIKAKYATPFDDQPFYFTFDADRKIPQLMDTGVLVAEFKDGEWKAPAEERVLARGEVRDITKEEFDAITGGKMPDVDPDQVMPL